MRNKYLGVITISLFVAVFGFILIKTFFYSRIYSGEPITKLMLVINDKPKFFFREIDYPNFYQFTAQKYKCYFQISGGALDIIDSNDNLQKEIKSINYHDTIYVDIKSTDTINLQKEESIKIIGLKKLNKELLIPKNVASTDKELQLTSIFCTLIILLVLGLLYYRKRLKIKLSD